MEWGIRDILLEATRYLYRIRLRLGVVGLPLFLAGHASDYLASHFQGSPGFAALIAQAAIFKVLLPFTIISQIADAYDGFRPQGPPPRQWYWTLVVLCLFALYYTLALILGYSLFLIGGVAVQTLAILAPVYITLDGDGPFEATANSVGAINARFWHVLGLVAIPLAVYYVTLYLLEMVRFLVVESGPAVHVLIHLLSDVLLLFQLAIATALYKYLPKDEDKNEMVTEVSGN